MREPIRLRLMSDAALLLLWEIGRLVRHETSSPSSAQGPSGATGVG
jgi:hypothetical protein